MIRNGQITIGLHGGLEVLAGAALIFAPFFIDFPVAGGVASFVLGVLLVGLALSAQDTHAERGSVPLSAHAAFDRVIAVVAIATAIGIGVAGGFATATLFMAGFGVAHLALTAATRYSAPRGA